MLDFGSSVDPASQPIDILLEMGGLRIERDAFAGFNVYRLAVLHGYHQLAVLQITNELDDLPFLRFEFCVYQFFHGFTSCHSQNLVVVAVLLFIYGLENLA